MRPYAKYKNGFSLVELCVVLVVIAILMQMTMSMVGLMDDRNDQQSTKQSLQEVEQALNSYLKLHGSLPCPASRSAARTSAGFGKSAGACNATAPAGTIDIASVRIGALPVKDLNLPDRYMFDSWGNRLTYAVVKDLAVDSATYNAFTTAATNGIITIKNRAGSQLSYANNKVIVSYVLISHGKTAKGAYNRDGSVITACSSTELDGRNCDNDAEFVDESYNDGSFTANKFDDIVSWKTKDRMEMQAGITYINTGVDSYMPLMEGTVVYNQNVTSSGTNTVTSNFYTLSSYPTAKFVRITGTCIGATTLYGQVDIEFQDATNTKLFGATVCSASLIGTSASSFFSPIPSKATKIKVTRSWVGVGLGITLSYNMDLLK